MIKKLPNFQENNLFIGAEDTFVVDCYGHEESTHEFSFRSTAMRFTGDVTNISVSESNKYLAAGSRSDLILSFVYKIQCISLKLYNTIVTF